MYRTFEKSVTAGTLAWLVGSGLPYAGAALADPAQPLGKQFQEAGAAHKVAVAPDAEMKDRWGVEIVSLRPTAHDHMLDFRYRVLDADKAAALFKRQTKPYLIHGPTGKVLAVPQTAKIGPLRNSNAPKEGRIYWMFFGNAGGLVKTGDKVTLVIGDFRAEDVTVQ